MTDKSKEPDKLAKQFQDEIGAIPEPSLPPVEKWNPAFSGDMDMRIARNGQWFYKGSPLQRQALVKLFSTILKRDEDGDYYLVTPVEKFRIQVEDAPFVAHSLEREGEERDQILWLTNNVGDRFRIDDEHPLIVETAPGSDEPAPYVRVRRNLDALVERQTFYALADLAVEGEGAHAGFFGVFSDGQFYRIGKAD
jgi:hypothetical protein